MQRRRNCPSLLAYSSERENNEGSGDLKSITYDPLQDLMTHNSSSDGDMETKHVAKTQDRDKNSAMGVLYPSLKELMASDEDYSKFLSPQLGSHGGIDSKSQEMCARICAGFSFIAILFLTFVGILIEVQPLYIKGIQLQKKEDGMHTVAKTSFKAAAAYFLVMILSIIYAQNHDRFRWEIFRRIKNAIHMRQHFAVAYNSYRRRKYNDIPENTNSVAPDLPTFDDIFNFNIDEEESDSEDHIPSFELWKKVNQMGRILSEKSKRR